MILPYSCSSSEKVTSTGFASNGSLDDEDLPDSFFEMEDELTVPYSPITQKSSSEPSNGLSSDLYPCAPVEERPVGISPKNRNIELENEEDEDDDFFLVEERMSCSQPISLTGALPFIDTLSNNYVNCKRWRDCNNENDNITTSRYGNIANLLV